MFTNVFRGAKSKFPVLWTEAQMTYLAFEEGFGKCFIVSSIVLCTISSDYFGNYSNWVLFMIFFLWNSEMGLTEHYQMGLTEHYQMGLKRAFPVNPIDYKLAKTFTKTCFLILIAEF